MTRCLVRRWAISAVLLVLCAVPSTAMGSSLTPYRFEPQTGGWTQLEPVNAYAMFSAEGPWQGGGGFGGSAQIVGRAVFEPDLNRAEISAEFVPVSTEIIQSDSRLFIAPLGRRLEWKVIVTVRNPNDVAMTSVKVQNQFGKAFRVTLAGRSNGDARIVDGDVRGLLPTSGGFIWDIGYLGPGAAARAELTVATSQSVGRAEFVEEGVYSIDTGFQLTYVLLGKGEARSTESCSVVARANPSALRADADPYTAVQRPIAQKPPLPERPVPQQPITARPGAQKPVEVRGQQAPAMIWRRAPELTTEELDLVKGEEAATKDMTRVDGSNRFTVTATAVTGNIGEDGGKFQLPTGEYAEWIVDLGVWNPFWIIPWGTWEAGLEFGPELEIQVESRTADSEVTVIQDPTSGKTVVAWRGAGLLPAGGGASARIRVRTKSPSHCGTPGEIVFIGDMYLDYWYWLLVPCHMRVDLDPIHAIVEATPRASVSVTATRLDWLVRKPGTYAALAMEITATGHGVLSVQFSGFADLTREGAASGAIAVFYGFGDTLADVEDAENAEMEKWRSAETLNDHVRKLSLSPSEATMERVWSMISVGEEISSAEYENKGVITFIVSNN